MVNKDSPLQGWADIRDKRIGVPSMDSNATVMFSAALVDLGYQGTLKNFTAIRYQEAVPFMIEKGFVDGGVAASGAMESAFRMRAPLHDKRTIDIGKRELAQPGGIVADYRAVTSMPSYPPPFAAFTQRPNSPAFDARQI